jgi:hypothetical protein
MARQPLSAREFAVPRSPSASAAESVARDGHVAELLPFQRPDLSTHDLDFQRLVTNIVELAKILTGARGSAIAFRGEQGTICRARSGEGAPPLGALVDTTSGISKQCLDSGASLRCDDIATDGRVDSEISQAIGIRALAVVPVYSNGNNNDDICGILEVFSNTPGVFTDHHLKTLQQLATWVGSAANLPSAVPIRGSNADVQLNRHRDITLLVALEPAYRAFFGNLADLVSLRSSARLARSSSQTDGWNDVLIESHIPWKRFIESVFLHVVVVGVLSGVSEIWPRELVLSPPSLRAAHVVYYPVSQSFPAQESSPPAVHPKRQHTSAHQEVIRAGRNTARRNHELLAASGIRATDNGQETHAFTTPPPSMPMVATNRSRKPELGVAVLPPPPEIDEAKARQSHPLDFSVVAPPPDLSGGPGLRKINAPKAAVVPPPPDVRGSISMKSAGLIGATQLGGRSARAADTSIVPPPPSLNDRAILTHGATGVPSRIGVQVVAPPSSIQDRDYLDSRASGISPGNGVSQVVPPPPSLEGGNSVPGARANSLAHGGSQVVPPAPSMENAGSYSGSGRNSSRISSLGHADSQVVPPPPSVQFGAGGNSGAAGRGQDSALAGARAEGILPPASAHGDGNSKLGGKLGGATVAKDISTSSVPQTGGDRKHPIFQDVQLRVISLTLAPSRSSYFSSFEVFIAEKWLNNNESELIKLVYEFLPYQQRLSEYGSDDLKVPRLRVTRDSTCDESLMQMAWPEGENGPPGSHHSGDTLASTATDRNNALPCYRTTADDYRRAVSRGR